MTQTTRVQVQRVSLRDRLEQEVFEGYLNNMLSKVPRLGAEEWAFVHVDNYGFVYYDGSENGESRLMELSLMELTGEFLNGDVSFQELVDKSIENLNKELKPDEHAFIMSIQDLNNYSRIVMFYAKSQDPKILEKLRDPYYNP